MWVLFNRRTNADIIQKSVILNTLVKQLYPIKLILPFNVLGKQLRINLTKKFLITITQLKKIVASPSFVIEGPPVAL